MKKFILTSFFLLFAFPLLASASTYAIKAKDLQFQAVNGRGKCNGIRVVDISLGKTIGGLGWYDGCPLISSRSQRALDFKIDKFENIFEITNILNEYVKSLDPENVLILTREQWMEKDPTHFISIVR